MPPHRMDHHEPDRIAALEERLERIERKLDRTSTSSGGIGCLGFVLFLIVIGMLNNVLKLLQAS